MYVSTEQVLTRTKARLSLMETTLHDAILEKYVNEGAMHLGSQRTQRIHCKELVIDCYKAALPDSFETFVAGQFPSGTCSCGCGCGSTAEEVLNSLSGIGNTCPVWYVNKDVLTNFNGQGASCGVYSNFFDIDGGFIVFPTTTTATHVKIWFEGWSTDDDGLMLIDEYWERGISSYAAMQFATDMIDAYKPEQRARWEAEWKAQKGHNKGRDNIKRFNLDKHSICQLMNSIISNTSIVGVYNVRSNF